MQLCLHLLVNTDVDLTCACLQTKYDSSSNTFAADTVAAVLESVKSAAGEGSGLNEKQLKQMAMPFAKYKMEEAQKGGLQVSFCCLHVVLSQCAINNRLYTERREWLRGFSAATRHVLASMSAHNNMWFAAAPRVWSSRLQGLLLQQGMIVVNCILCHLCHRYLM